MQDSSRRGDSTAGSWDGELERVVSAVADRTCSAQHYAQSGTETETYRPAITPLVAQTHRCPNSPISKIRWPNRTRNCSRTTDRGLSAFDWTRTNTSPHTHPETGVVLHLVSGDHSKRRGFLGPIGVTGVTALACCAGGCSESAETAGGGGGSSDDTSTAAPGSAQMGGTLQWDGAVPVRGLDPHIDSSAASKRVLETIYEELVRQQDGYTIEPHLATSLEQSENNTLLSVDLRESVTFHDLEADTYHIYE